MSKSGLPSSNDLLRSKGSDRIQINNILSAICIGILSILLNLSAGRASVWLVTQLAISIPLLVTSSLAYSKTCYRKIAEYRMWDALGWVTHSIGYGMILNALVIMLHGSGYQTVAWLFVGTTVLLFVCYSVLDVWADRRRLKEKALKLVSYLLLLFMGSVFPILFGWV